MVPCYVFSNCVGNQNTIRDEVKKIFQPLSFTCSKSSQFMYPSALERRPYIGKGKGRFIHAKYIQKKKPRFHKKIIVIRHMGPKAPGVFNLKENLVLLCGMLPEIGYEFSEKQIRKCICDTINASEQASIVIEPDDFEFLEAYGKRLWVPAQTSELEWTGKALKQLAGSGCIYVQLIRDMCVDESENSDSIDSEVSCSSPELKIVKVETPGNEVDN